MKEQINKLLNYSLSPYELVDYCKIQRDVAIPILKKLVIKHESPYVRLCAAWSLGELNDRSVLPILQKAYRQETEENVRANLVWALFMIDPHTIDEKLFEAFIEDKYYIIPLIALKRLSGLHNVQRKYNFEKYYGEHTNLLVGLELLRNIRSFVHQKDINNYLKQELHTTHEPLLRIELINAIGATNHMDSLDILMDYYSDYKLDITRNEELAYALVNAMLSLSQSDPYNILHEIYINQKSKIIRWRIIETLASSGGPKSLGVLKEIYKSETDSGLKQTIQQFINLTKVTNK